MEGWGGGEVVTSLGESWVWGLTRYGVNRSVNFTAANWDLDLSAIADRL
jgi:hypothetical protein